jgi:riboflavin transporter FmnP
MLFLCFSAPKGGFFVSRERQIMNTKKITTKDLVVCGLFCAIAYVFTYIGRIIPQFQGFLSLDPKDSIIVIAGFALGPWATIAISIVVAFIESVSNSSTQLIGFIMNVISSVSFAFLPSLLYKKNRKFKTAIIGMLISTLVTVAVMLLWNYLITPVYQGVPRSVVAGMLLPVFLPFNAIKCAMNMVLVILLYKPFVKALRHMVLLNPSKKRKK